MEKLFPTIYFVCCDERISDKVPSQELLFELQQEIEIFIEAHQESLDKIAEDAGILLGGLDGWVDGDDDDEDDDDDDEEEDEDAAADAEVVDDRIFEGEDVDDDHEDLDDLQGQYRREILVNNNGDAFYLNNDGDHDSDNDIDDEPIDTDVLDGGKVLYQSQMELNEAFHQRREQQYSKLVSRPIDMTTTDNSNLMVNGSTSFRSSRLRGINRSNEAAMEASPTPTKEPKRENPNGTSTDIRKMKTRIKRNFDRQSEAAGTATTTTSINRTTLATAALLENKLEAEQDGTMKPNPTTTTLSANSSAVHEQGDDEEDDDDPALGKLGPLGGCAECGAKRSPQWRAKG